MSELFSCTACAVVLGKSWKEFSCRCWPYWCAVNKPSQLSALYIPFSLPLGRAREFDRRRQVSAYRTFRRPLPKPHRGCWFTNSEQCIHRHDRGENPSRKVVQNHVRERQKWNITFASGFRCTLRGLIREGVIFFVLAESERKVWDAVAGLSSCLSFYTSEQFNDKENFNVNASMTLILHCITRVTSSSFCKFSGLLGLFCASTDAHGKSVTDIFYLRLPCQEATMSPLKQLFTNKDWPFRGAD